jgi:hypothetical protein
MLRHIASHSSQYWSTVHLGFMVELCCGLGHSLACRIQMRRQPTGVAPQSANSLYLGLAAGHPSDVVTTRDESRDELLSQRPTWRLRPGSS